MAVRDYHYTDAISPYTDFDRLDDLHLNPDLSSPSLDETMNHIVQVESARARRGVSATTTRRPSLDAGRSEERRWFPRRLFPKHSLWDSNVLWAALAALVLATSSMAVVGFTLLARPSSSSLGVHFACVAPPGDKTTAYLDTFQDSHAIVGALVQLATFSVLGLVSLYVGIQCSFSQQKVMSNPHNSNLMSAFVLPCYGTIWYTVAVLSVTEIAVIASSQVEYVQAHRRPFCIVLNLPSMWIRHLIPLMMLQKSVSQRAVHRAIALSGILTAAVLSVLVEPDTFPIVFIVYPIAVMLLSAFVKFVLHTRASFDLYFYFLLVSCVANILPPVVWLAAADASTPHVVVMLSIAAPVVDGGTLAAVMLTLRVDTMYWLGLDTPSSNTNDPAKLYLRMIADQGMVSSFSTRTSVYDVHFLIETFKHR